MGIMSPWGPGVQDSQADQEHPACPVEGQRAVRSTRSHDTSPPLETQPSETGAGPRPATCPARPPALRLPPQGLPGFCKLSSQSVNPPRVQCWHLVSPVSGD